MNVEQIVFENAEGAETRTKKLNILAKKHNQTALQTMQNDGWSINATTVYQPIEAGGTPVINHTHKQFRYNIAEKKLYIDEDGIYTMDANLSLAIPNNIEASIAIFINGINYQPNTPINITGRGATRPLPVTMIMTLELNKGDYLQMMILVDIDSVVTCTGNNARIEKKSIG